MTVVLPTRNEVAAIAGGNQRMIRWFEDVTALLRDDAEALFLVGRLVARVNFNGTGTVAIRSAANIASITDLGAGNYRLNFAVAEPDANYSVALSSSGGRITVAATNYLTTSVNIECRNESGVLTDVATISAVVFR